MHGYLTCSTVVFVLIFKCNLIGVNVHFETQTVEQEVTSQAPINSPYRQIPMGSIPETHNIGYQTSPQHNIYSQEIAYSSLNTVAQENFDPSVTAAVHQPQPQFGQTQYTQYSSSRDHYCNNDISQPLMHNTSYFTASRNTPVSSTKTSTHDLPNYKIPVDSPILWQLSQEVREWKFLGRFLDLDEDVIEEIDQYTRPNKTRDKSLKVLKEWVNSSPEPTWKALGGVLLETENALLYEKLLELIKSYNI